MPSHSWNTKYHLVITNQSTHQPAVAIANAPASAEKSPCKHTQYRKMHNQVHKIFCGKRETINMVRSAQILLNAWCFQTTLRIQLASMSPNSLCLKSASAETGPITLTQLGGPETYEKASGPLSQPVVSQIDKIVLVSKALEPAMPKSRLHFESKRLFWTPSLPLSLRPTLVGPCWTHNQPPGPKLRIRPCLLCRCCLHRSGQFYVQICPQAFMANVSCSDTGMLYLWSTVISFIWPSCKHATWDMQQTSLPLLQPSRSFIDAIPSWRHLVLSHTNIEARVTIMRWVQLCCYSFLCLKWTTSLKHAITWHDLRLERVIWWYVCTSTVTWDWTHP